MKSILDIDEMKERKILDGDLLQTILENPDMLQSILAPFLK